MKCLSILTYIINYQEVVMNEVIDKYTNSAFEKIKHIDEEGNEYWLARELMLALEYKRWDKFCNVIEKRKRLVKKVTIYYQTIFPKWEEWLKYAEEADILNVSLFNTTAKEWRELNPVLAKTSNIRDYASLNELTVLSNLESHNAEMIKEGKNKEERFEILSGIAKYQLEILNNAEKIKLLGDSKEYEEQI